MKILISSFLIFALLPYSSIFALDNTELLDAEKPVTPPGFEYRTFSSCQDFQSTMESILPKNIPNYYGRWGGMPMAIDAVAPTTMEKSSSPAPLASSREVIQSSWDTAYSQTNTQVFGIDEADTVKTDGKYLYTYSESEKAIVILDARTLERIKSIKIPSNYASPSFYLTKNKLILTATKYGAYNASWYGWYNNEQKSIIALYDISTPSRVSLIRVMQIDGALSDSRIADDGMMTAVIATSYWTPPLYRGYDMSMKSTESMKWVTPKYEYSEKTLVPKISDTTYLRGTPKMTNRTIADCNRMSSLLPDTKTLKNYQFSPTLTSIVRFDTTLSGPITSQVVLSEAWQIHLSRNSIYLTSNMWSPSGYVSSCPANARCAMPAIWNNWVSTTLVHRFAFDGIRTRYVYSRSISGSPLTQYSMDEDAAKNFRIVTTLSSPERSTRVSILSPTGNLLGALSDIAPGENFQSSRFIGNRLYLVTFQQIDPLFVIDLSLSKSPRILWELKIPGYSTYLHPYDSDRLIGVGYDTKVNTWW
jgi:inhibitor of cysteine peptidase